MIFNDQNLKQKRKLLRKNQTDAEKLLWGVLRNRKTKGLKFFRQYSVGKYILDFYCPKIKLAIELDGGQHNQPNEASRDEKRTSYLNNFNIKLIRFWNHDVLQNPEGVYDTIIKSTNNSSPPPLNLRGGV